MSSNRLRRIAKEIEETTKDKEARVILQPAGGQSDLTHLEGRFTGPPDTPYEGGQFSIDIKIPNDYPFRPPIMKFATKIWHPNVSSQTGAICLDTLSTGWSPVLTLKAALQSIQGLLESPEPKDPQDAEVASMLLTNPEEFKRVARQWTIKYAEATPKPGEGGATKGSAHIKPDPEKERLEEEKRKKKIQYRGYNEGLVERFCALGFDVPSVVTAFEHCSIDKNEGRDYQLSEARTNSVTAQLFGDL